ncbi:unnamed protein product, partial [Ilex paraguariensis]
FSYRSSHQASKEQTNSSRKMLALMGLIRDRLSTESRPMLDAHPAPSIYKLQPVFIQEEDLQ